MLLKRCTICCCFVLPPCYKCLPWFHFQKNTKSPFLQKKKLCVYIPYNIEHSLSERWKKKKENKKNNSREFGEPFFLLFYVAYSFSPSFSLLPFVCAQNIFPFFWEKNEWWLLMMLIVCMCVDVWNSQKWCLLMWEIAAAALEIINK